MPVNQMDPTPLYEQLAAILRAQMSDGALSSGALLPSESYLQQEHGVSRSTVRAAAGSQRCQSRRGASRAGGSARR